MYQSCILVNNKWINFGESLDCTILYFIFGYGLLNPPRLFDSLDYYFLKKIPIHIPRLLRNPLYLKPYSTDRNPKKWTFENTISRHCNLQDYQNWSKRFIIKISDWYLEDWLFYRTICKMSKKLVFKIQNGL